MIFIGSTNEMLGSKLIRWGTRSETSHFAIGFDLGGRGVDILESTFSQGGVRQITYEYFKTYQQITQELHVPLPPNTERELFNLVLDRVKGKKYDNNAIAYWGIRLVMNRYMCIPLPSHNQWGDRDRLYCVEVLSALREWLAGVGVVFDKEIEMIHPGEAFEYLKQIRI